MHDVDKLELILQMLEYERVHEHKLDLGEFSWVSSRIELPEVKAWSDEVLKEREQFWGDKEHGCYDENRPPADKRLKEKLEYYGGGKENAHDNIMAKEVVSTGGAASEVASDVANGGPNGKA